MYHWHLLLLDFDNKALADRQNPRHMKVLAGGKINRSQFRALLATARVLPRPHWRIVAVTDTGERVVMAERKNADPQPTI